MNWPCPRNLVATLDNRRSNSFLYVITVRSWRELLAGAYREAVPKLRFSDTRRKHRPLPPGPRQGQRSLLSADGNERPFSPPGRRSSSRSSNPEHRICNSSSMAPFILKATKHGPLALRRGGCCFGLLVAAISGCTFSSNTDRSAEQPRLAQPFKITISSGGGFTGLYRGFRLYSTGRVERWERFAAGGDSVLWVTAVDPGQIEFWGASSSRAGCCPGTTGEPAT